MAKELEDSKKDKTRLEEAMNEEAAKRKEESKAFKELEEKVQT